MTQRRNEYLVKIIVIGDSGVGKTNLITRFCENTFRDSYVATIGVDFKVKTIPVDDKRIKMQIWDTAGQERFKNITQTYYKGASGILLVYSITDDKSFENIKKWIGQIDNNAPEGVCKVLIGTKCDAEIDRAVSIEAGRQFAKENGIVFMESSAKSGFQVKDAFEMLAKEIAKVNVEETIVKTRLTEKRLAFTPAGQSQSDCKC